MLKVYRLEDMFGNGPFFFRNGVSRFNPEITFECKELYAFSDISRFNEPSYIDFYNDDAFHLFELCLSEVAKEKNGHVIFNECCIISKREMEKVQL